MRTLLLAILALVLSAPLAQAQKTPPGGDMVGSDRPMSHNDVRTEPAVSPDANQQITNTNGTSSGYEGNPAYAGSSSYGTASAVRNDRSGMRGQASATDARRHSSRTLRGRKNAGKRAAKQDNRPH